MATDSIVSAGTSISTSTCSSWNHHMNSHQLNKTCLIFSQHDLMSSNLALPGFVVRLGTNELGTPGQEIWTLYEHSTQSCHKMILNKSSCNVLHPPACCFMVKSPSTFSPVLKLKHLKAMLAGVLQPQNRLPHGHGQAMAHVMAWTNHHTIRSFGIAATSVKVSRTMMNRTCLHRLNTLQISSNRSVCITISAFHATTILQLNN